MNLKLFCLCFGAFTSAHSIPAAASTASNDLTTGQNPIPDISSELKGWDFGFAADFYLELNSILEQSAAIQSETSTSPIVITDSNQVITDSNQSQGLQNPLNIPNQAINQPSVTLQSSAVNGLVTETPSVESQAEGLTAVPLSSSLVSVVSPDGRVLVPAQQQVVIDPRTGLRPVLTTAGPSSSSRESSREGVPVQRQVVIDSRTGIPVVTGSSSETSRVGQAQIVINPRTGLPILTVPVSESSRGGVPVQRQTQIAIDPRTGLPVLTGGSPSEGTSSSIPQILIDPRTGIPIITTQNQIPIAIDPRTGLPIVSGSSTSTSESSRGGGVPVQRQTQIAIDPRTGLPVVTGSSRETSREQTRGGNQISIDPITGLPVVIGPSREPSREQTRGGNQISIDPITGLPVVIGPQTRTSEPIEPRIGTEIDPTVPQREGGRGSTIEISGSSRGSTANREESSESEGRTKGIFGKIFGSSSSESSSTTSSEPRKGGSGESTTSTSEKSSGGGILESIFGSSQSSSSSQESSSGESGGGILDSAKRILAKIFGSSSSSTSSDTGEGMSSSSGTEETSRQQPVGSNRQVIITSISSESLPTFLPDGESSSSGAFPGGSSSRMPLPTQRQSREPSNSFPVLNRPPQVPICDFYSQALFNENTERSQLKLMTALVNTVLIGNYTPTVNNQQVTGILAPSRFNGETIELMGFFTGTKGATANVDGKATANINFLDGGAAEPLKQNLASNNPNSRQEKLVNHLYGVFASLSGCSKQGGQALPLYAGKSSMTEVHKFMGLNEAKLSFFNDQVAQAARGFGVTDSDAKALQTSLETIFNVQCAAPAKLTPQSDLQPQGFCLDVNCKVASNPVCPSNVDNPAAQKTGISAQKSISSSGYRTEMSLYLILLTFVYL